LVLYLVTMKKLFCAFFVTVAVFLFFSAACLAQDYEGALRTAKNQNKPLLLYFYSKTCYYCGLMDKKTLADKNVSAAVNRDFVFLRIDVDRSIDLARLYRITGTPSSWFLESTGKRLFEAPGYIEKSEYTAILDYVKGKHYNEMDLMAYMKKTSGSK
jgi:thioredoxin-related protein